MSSSVPKLVMLSSQQLTSALRKIVTVHGSYSPQLVGAMKSVGLRLKKPCVGCIRSGNIVSTIALHSACRRLSVSPISNVADNNFKYSFTLLILYPFDAYTCIVTQNNKLSNNYLHCEIFAQVYLFNHFVADDFGTGAVFQDFAVVQNITAVRDAQCFTHIVVGDNHAQTTIL